MLEKLVKDVFNWIVKQNSRENIDAIPHSDTLIKNIHSTIGIDENDLKKIIGLLKESNKILIFEIVKEDKDHNVEKIEGYIDADLKTIGRLKNYFQNILVEEYNKKYGQNLMANQVIKEIFPKIHMFNNTPLGHIVNKAIMLSEFEKLVEKEYNNYTEDLKEKKLNELIEENKGLFEKEKRKDTDEQKTDDTKKASDKDRRAIDSQNYDKYSKTSSKDSLSKVLHIYGIDFFYRVNLRKCNFDIIIHAIESREINRKPDLKKLKDMIAKLKLKIKSDEKLSKNSEQLYKLERTISRYILTSNR